MYGKKRGSRSEGYTRWNEEVKKAISRMKYAHKAVCQVNAEGNKNRYKCMKNK